MNDLINDKQELAGCKMWWMPPKHWFSPGIYEDIYDVNYIEKGGFLVREVVDEYLAQRGMTITDEAFDKFSRWVTGIIERAKEALDSGKTPDEVRLMLLRGELDKGFE